MYKVVSQRRDEHMDIYSHHEDAIYNWVPYIYYKHIIDNTAPANSEVRFQNISPWNQSQPCMVS